MFLGYLRGARCQTVKEVRLNKRILERTFRHHLCQSNFKHSRYQTKRLFCLAVIIIVLAWPKKESQDIYESTLTEGVPIFAFLDIRCRWYSSSGGNTTVSHLQLVTICNGHVCTCIFAAVSKTLQPISRWMRSPYPF